MAGLQVALDGSRDGLPTAFSLMHDDCTPRRGNLTVNTTLALGLDSGLSSSTSPYSVSACSHLSSAASLVTNDTLYTPIEIRNMAEELDSAQRAGEFPATKYLNHSPKITVEDHKKLMELRDAARAQDQSQAPAMLVALTRDVRERDSELDDELERARVVRQVDSCLRAAKEEDRILRIIKTALSQNTHAVSKRDLKQAEGRIASKQDLERVKESIASKQDLSQIVKGIDDVCAFIQSKISDASGFLHEDIGLIGSHLGIISGQVEALHKSLCQVDDLTAQIEDMTALVTRVPEMIQEAVMASLNAVTTDTETSSHQHSSEITPGQAKALQTPTNAFSVTIGEYTPRCSGVRVYPDHKSPFMMSVQEVPEAELVPRRELIPVSGGGWKRSLHKMRRRLRRATMELGVSTE